MQIRNEPMGVYFVWTKTGRNPKKAHNTYEVARAEAIRLATLHPDRKFIVMHAIGKFSVAANDIGPTAPALAQDAQQVAA